MHLILYFHITFPGFECSNSCCITALLHASWEYKWANNCDDVWCVVTLCHATCHALSVMSVSDTTLARNKSQQNISEYKVIRKSISGHTMGLTLALLLKYLAQCETINYVWYFQERVWWPGRSALTYLELATQLVEVSIFKKLLIWTYVRAVNTQLTNAVHMKYDSNKLQQNHFYMCNIDIIANTMQHF